MAVIKDGVGAALLGVDGTSKAARVTLYDPQGNAVVSSIRGVGADFDDSSGTQILDLVGIALPGTGGAKIGGTALAPLRTDPTGTTTQPVSGNVNVGNFPTTQPVSGSVNVGNFPATQPVSGNVGVNNFPTTQQVAGTVTVANPVSSLAVNNFPSTQPVSGNLGANLRVGSADVSTNNPVSTQVVGGAISINNATSAPVPVSVVDPNIGLSFCAAFDIVPTTVTAGTVYFALRNNSTKIIFIRRLDIQQGFYGTAAASRSAFEFVRFTGTAPSGGTAGTVVKKDTTSSATTVGVQYAAAGLTVSGTTFEAGSVHRQASVNQLSAISTQDVDFGSRVDGWLQLQPGEGLAVRASGAVVAGAYMIGSLGWREL